MMNYSQVFVIIMEVHYCPTNLMADKPILRIAPVYECLSSGRKFFDSPGVL